MVRARRFDASTPHNKCGTRHSCARPCTQAHFHAHKVHLARAHTNFIPRRSAWTDTPEERDAKYFEELAAQESEAAYLGALTAEEKATIEAAEAEAQEKKMLASANATPEAAAAAAQRMLSESGDTSVILAKAGSSMVDMHLKKAKPTAEMSKQELWKAFLKDKKRKEKEKKKRKKDKERGRDRKAKAEPVPFEWDRETAFKLRREKSAGDVARDVTEAKALAMAFSFGGVKQ